MKEKSFSPVDGPALQQTIRHIESVGSIEFAAFLIYCHELQILGFNEKPLWSKLKDEQKQKYLRIADNQFMAWKQGEIDALKSQLERYENWQKEHQGD